MSARNWMIKKKNANRPLVSISLYACMVNLHSDSIALFVKIAKALIPIYFEFSWLLWVLSKIASIVTLLCGILVMCIVIRV